MDILTILIILVTWFFMLVLEPASRLHYEDGLNKSEKRRGVSVSPIYLVFPLTAIALMYLTNYFYDPTGTYVFLSLHVLFLLISMGGATYRDLKRTHNIEYFGSWVFTIVNLLICLVIVVSVPYLTWKVGTHWAFVVLSAAVSFTGAGFLAERVLFRLTWADRIFGETKDLPGKKRISLKELSRQAHKRRQEQETARQTLNRLHEKEIQKRAHEKFIRKETARRTSSRWIDYKDFSTELEMAELMLGTDLDQKEFTIDDGIPSIFKENFFYEFVKKSTPTSNPRKYYIDESGIRITSEHGPEEFYTYADIEAIDMKYYEVDSGIMGEGRWERPLPIYKANLLFITAGGKRQEIPDTSPDTVLHNALPRNALWFIIQQYNKIREKEYKKTLKAGGEIPIGRDSTGEAIHMNSRGFRSESRFLPLEEVWWATIRENGSVVLTDMRGDDLLIILDYALPESYLALHFIRAMVIPKRIPIKDRKFLPGAINRIKTKKTVAFFAAISLICFVVSGYCAYNGIAAKTWPETGGIVLSSKALDLTGENPGWAYIVVSYRYEVNGLSYISDRFKYGGKTFAFIASARRFAENYPQGREIPVFYNPANHQQAVLESGTGFYFYAALFSAVFFLFLAIEFHVFIFRKAEEIRKRYR